MATKASRRAVEEDLANVEFETSEDVEVRSVQKLVLINVLEFGVREKINAFIWLIDSKNLFVGDKNESQKTGRGGNDRNAQYISISPS